MSLVRFIHLELTHHVGYGVGHCGRHHGLCNEDTVSAVSAVSTGWGTEAVTMVCAKGGWGGEGRGEKSDGGLGALRHGHHGLCDAAMTVVVAVVAVVLLPGLCSLQVQ
jgi:hypothetical protein